MKDLKAKEPNKPESFSGNRVWKWNTDSANGTDAIRTTSTKTEIVAMMEGAFAGKEILTTEDGSESATAKHSIN
jgi:hypothetical protein